VVEWAGFENRYIRKGIGGSNPPASAGLNNTILMSTSQSAVEQLKRQLESETKEYEKQESKLREIERERDKEKSKAMQLKTELERQEQKVAQLDADLIARKAQLETIRQTQEHRRLEVEQAQRDLEESLKKTK
jgi:hypothetical protein